MIVRYRPEGAAEVALAWAAQLPGKVGRRAKLRIDRRYAARAIAAFNARVSRLGVGDVCLDMGANVGVYTEILAATGATVHAYEPDPWSMDQLQARFADNPRVHLHAAAVGAMAGTAMLHRKRHFADNTARHSQSSTIVPADADRFVSSGIQVNVLAFRDVVAGIGRPVALAKIDIEGAEFDILEEIFARPADYDVEAIFAETHERANPDRIARVDAMRRMAETLDRPSINLFWP